SLIGDDRNALERAHVDLPKILRLTNRNADGAGLGAEGESSGHDFLLLANWLRNDEQAVHYDIDMIRSKLILALIVTNALRRARPRPQHCWRSLRAPILYGIHTEYFMATFTLEGAKWPTTTVTWSFAT